MAAETAPRTVAEIIPERLYSSHDAASVIPSAKGGLLTPGAVNLLCKRGSLKSRYIPSGPNRGYYVIEGAALLEYLTGVTPPVRGTSTKRANAAMKRIAALKTKKQKQSAR